MSKYPPVEAPPKAFGNEEKGYIADDGNIGAEAEQLAMDKDGHVISETTDPRALHRKLKSRHMQMIAIGMLGGFGPG